jgi:hypothetical protein
MSLIPPSISPNPIPEGDGDEDLANSFREHIADIQSRLFDKASTYSNLIIVAGYVGAFTVWGKTSIQLTNYTNVVIASCLGFSITVFSIYQIWKMAMHVAHFNEVRKLLSETLTVSDFFERYNAIQKKVTRKTLRTSALAAVICFFLCTLPAAVALAILFYNFFAILMGWPTASGALSPPSTGP